MRQKKVKIKYIEEDIYIIPNGKEDKFDRLLTEYYKFSPHSEARQEILETIEYEFGEFRVEDVNDIQLYIK